MSVTVFVGRNGAGKDAAAIEYGVIPCWQYGRAVVANCNLYPEELGYDRNLFLPLGDPTVTLVRLGVHQRLLCRRCERVVHPSRNGGQCVCGGEVVLVTRRWHDGSPWSITGNRGVGLMISDVTAAFPSRESVGSVPPEVARTLQQLRKPDIAPVMITCPAWARVDKLLRECMMTVVECMPFTPFGLWRDKPDVPWGWPRNRAYLRVFWDAQDYESADATGRWDLIEPQKRRFRLSQRKVRRIHSAYDSFEDVQLSDHLQCAECGGRFNRAVCRDPLGHKEQTIKLRPEREAAEYPVVPSSTVQVLDDDDDQDDEESEVYRRALRAS